MANEWVLVLEVARPTGAEALEPERITEVLVALADIAPVALICSDRFALQMSVVSDGPAEALLVGLSRWRDAAGRLCLPRWELARAEVMVPAEHEGDCSDLTGRVPAVADQSASEGRGDRAEAILEVAFRDPLTGLATQGLFSDSLERALAQGAAVGRVHALLLVELDCRAGINSRQARASGGDRMLVAAAKRLAMTVREADMVARLSTDQFAVLLRNTRSPAAEIVAQRIVERVSGSVPDGPGEITSRATVGMAVGHPDQIGADLLQEAAAALIVAKARGGDRSLSFTAASLVPAVAELRFDAMLTPPGGGTSDARADHRSE